MSRTMTPENFAITTAEQLVAEIARVMSTRRPDDEYVVISTNVSEDAFVELMESDYNHAVLDYDNGCVKVRRTRTWPVPNRIN